MTQDLQNVDGQPCPACGGSGKVSRTYHYKAQTRSNHLKEDLDRATSCNLCAGIGLVDTRIHADWKVLQDQPVCPACKGVGGKYTWSWDELDTGTHKKFSFEPCTVCTGKQHLTQSQLANYERERRKLRFWGVGCTVLFVVVAIFVITRVTSLFVTRTPWIQCCAPPHVVLISGLVFASRRWGRI